ncbi:MAG: glutamate racemase [Candidatus Hydrogenedentes bacterium]|nr:glutamate racemase [Candidatus Hydrogenedentota bacterium]
MVDSNAAIGIFDSGVGGLTVFARVAQRLPHESIIYLGDTARVPYGTKSGETVQRYAAACANVLVSRGIKMLVVACNTASAHALETLRKDLDVPVIGVIMPGAQAAVERTRNGRIGVIGTASTIGSKAYDDAILGLAPSARVFSKACPLFVPLAEEGWVDGAVPRQVARIYLEELLDNGVDTLVLGCTHYPLLRDILEETVGAQVSLVDSAEATSHAVAAMMDELCLSRDPNASLEYTYLVTDAPENFARVGERFLGHAISPVEWVDV